MKSKLITLLLACLISNVAYSQINLDRRTQNKPSQEFSFDNHLYFPADSLTGFFFPTSPLTNHSMPLYGHEEYQSPTERKFFTDVDYYYFKMPCLKPEGMFTMDILKPDPNMRHTMLIK